MTRTIFVTGGSGYIGSYVVDHLLRDTDLRLAILIRAEDRAQAESKLWRGLQMHVDAPRFWGMVDRIDFVLGDLTAPRLGIEPGAYDRLVRSAESVIHLAASLNRKSERACMNTNLRGTLAVLKMARDVAEHHGLRRFSHVSTVAVAGERHSEVVQEDEAIDWNRRDYDPYARTKKLTEHMVRELLPDTPITIFRPSIAMGDSTHPETSAFDMVQATCMLADMPVLGMRDDIRVDIVNTDWVGRAIATIHQKPEPTWDCYHLSGGTASNTTGEIARAISDALGRRRTHFVPALGPAFVAAIRGINALPGRSAVTYVGALMKVFWPYITFDTVFDNGRAVEELGEAPTPFVEYCPPLYRWAKEHGYRYPHRALPERPMTVTVPSEIHA